MSQALEANPSQRVCVCMGLHQRLLLCLGFLIFPMKIMGNDLNYLSKPEIINSGKHTDFFGEEVQPLSGNNVY